MSGPGALEEGVAKAPGVVLHNGSGGIPLQEVARILGVKRPYLYGIPMVAKVTPHKGIGDKGKSAKLLRPAEVKKLKRLIA